MSSIRYGFFGEDEAQRLFLHHYLITLAAGQSYSFEADASFRLIGGNKTQVDKQFDEACEIGLLRHQQHCFFIGRDLDDYSTTAFEEKIAAMRERLNQRRLSAVLLIPVQCIEHWLMYLQWRLANPKLSKNMSFETTPRKEAKTKIYGKPKLPLSLALPIVEQLAASIDIDWLASRSTSFLVFHRQVLEYLQEQGLLAAS